MRYFIAFISISFLLSSLGCKKSPELATDYIPVFAGNVETNVSYKKVNFSASFNNLDPANATDCGFEWSQKSDGTINTVGIGTISEDKFSVQLAAKLDEGIEYQVRAWIKVGSKKFYSERAYFYGTVARKPEIISLNRPYALWGDTIRIKVRNLPADILSSDVTVMIYNVALQPFFADSTEIAVIMPYSTIHGNLTIRLFVNKQSATNTSEIENAIPQVTSISKETVNIEDTLTLQGKFRTEYSNRIFPVTDLVNLNKYEIVSYTNDKIVFKISEVNKCSSVIDINLVIKSNQPGSNNFVSYSSYSLKRTGPWKVLNPAVPSNKTISATINGEAYLLDRTTNYYSNSPFYKYTPATDHWTVLKSNPSPSFEYQSLVTCKGEIYAGFLRNAEQTTNFFRYNIKSNTWSPCANLSSYYVFNMITATIQDKIYVFINPTKEKWVYDPSFDSWTQSYCDVPDLIGSARSFIYNGDYYFYRATSGNLLYKYNLSSDTFSPIYFSGLDSMNDFFMINGKCYCTSGCNVYELNFSNKSLIPKTELSNYLSNVFQFWSDTFFMEYENTAYFLAAPNTAVSLTSGNK
jgi:hypothetical protein